MKGDPAHPPPDDGDFGPITVPLRRATPATLTSGTIPDAAADTAARRLPSGARPGATARTAGAQEPPWSRRRSPSLRARVTDCMAPAGIRDRHRPGGLLLAILQRRIGIGDRSSAPRWRCRRTTPYRRDRAAVLLQRNEGLATHRNGHAPHQLRPPCMDNLPLARR